MVTMFLSGPLLTGYTQVRAPQVVHGAQPDKCWSIVSDANSGVIQDLHDCSFLQQEAGSICEATTPAQLVDLRTVKIYEATQVSDSIPPMLKLPLTPNPSCRQSTIGTIEKLTPSTSHTDQFLLAPSPNLR